MSWLYEKFAEETVKELTKQQRRSCRNVKRSINMNENGQPTLAIFIRAGCGKARTALGDGPGIAHSVAFTKSETGL